MYTIIEIENNKIYTKSNLCERIDIFEIVEKIPENYSVWNIGENMIDGYIPLCKNAQPGNKECFEIDLTSLKAIKLPDDEISKLRNAASVGICDKATAQKALKSKRRGYWNDRKREQAKNTIEIFERISE